MADITIIAHPTQFVAAPRTEIDACTDEHKVWAELMKAFEARDLAYTGKPCGATFHDPEYHESDTNIEIWEPISPGTVASESPAVRGLSEQQVMVVAFRGSYSQFGPVNKRLAKYITCSGLRIVSPMYNRYIVGLDKINDPVQYFTEACIPAARERIL